MKKLPINKLVKKEEEYEEEKPELEELDWWSKYYESLKELYNQVRFHESCLAKDVLWVGPIFLPCPVSLK